MNDIFAYALPLAMAAVAIVLLMGLFNMMRAGDQKKSQSLMRWRVVLQGLAILIAMVILLASQSGS